MSPAFFWISHSVENFSKEVNQIEPFQENKMLFKIQQLHMKTDYRKTDYVLRHISKHTLLTKTFKNIYIAFSMDNDTGV